MWSVLPCEYEHSSEENLKRDGHEDKRNDEECTPAKLSINEVRDQAQVEGR